MKEKNKLILNLFYYMMGILTGIIISGILNHYNLL